MSMKLNLKTTSHLLIVTLKDPKFDGSKGTFLKQLQE